MRPVPPAVAGFDSDRSKRHVTALNASARPTSGRTVRLTVPIRSRWSSVIVPTPVPSLTNAPIGSLSSTVNRSAPSTISSVSVATAIVAVVSPGSKRNAPMVAV